MGRRSVEIVLASLDAMPEATARPSATTPAATRTTVFWEIMSPDGGGEPAGDLAAAIDDMFGGVDELKGQVNDGGVKRFGSGWTWLVWDGTGLAVHSTPNQDTPI